MEVSLLNLSNDRTRDPVDAALSVVPFVNHLKERIKSRRDVRSQQLSYILDRLQSFPHWEDDITLDKLDSFAGIFELIHLSLAAPLTDENETLWALTLPFKPQLFYGTNAIFNLLRNHNGEVKKNILEASVSDENEHHRLNIIYSIILERFYNYSLSAQHGFIHNIKDEKSGLNKYFLLDFDTRFIDIEFDGTLPEIAFDNLKLLEDSRLGALDILQQFLPLEKFKFKGFSIIRIKDVTTQQVIEHIKDIIVNLSPEKNVYADITDALREILGSPYFDVTLMPVVKLNGRLINNCFDNLNENMRQDCDKYNMPIQSYMEAIQKFTEQPEVIFRKNLKPVEGEDKLYDILRGIGVKGLLVLPIFFQKQIVGILSVYSWEDNVMNENILATLEPAIPLLEQLLQTSIDDFSITLDNVVKEKFTSLQPSVEWRFNEVAFDYLQQKKSKGKAEVAQVYFEDVHPLYGAIDIRNSTLERNMALSADMQSQLQFLIELLDKLRHKKDLGIVSEMIYKCRKWSEQISEFITSDDEFLLNLFFEEEVTPFLLHFQQTNPSLKEPINDYFIAIGPSGVAFNNRRSLETSLQMLNQMIGNLLEQMNVEIQSTYPCYFEKYRSDGVEYDIYIGQSITPDKEFHPLYLKNLRLWQLNSMAVIAKLTHAIKQELPRKLETTQLIFVHSNTIDISFRSDEHRFDVEGAYNIRYEMIKKRIDKVKIKDTEQRLTQPGKIALVYFHPKDVEEYISHIHYLQDQQILTEEIEFLELEELQGVTGLKAIRVSVLMDDELNTPMVDKDGNIVSVNH
ncbi:GAF domain-containing protein [Taibaiella lutea]|uniref:GAF domain-containing protein n=1 Tax=Taibaiella lutea TaxID=2608001 RepID=A0A5M6CR84_9BACT|nr:GAF domain-containing protein [Taibaiella lutea]KAA5536472.1 GAF domain-containing protein [Taibaiella lutea]